jgi:hypothetical protein
MRVARATVAAAGAAADRATPAAAHWQRPVAGSQTCGEVQLRTKNP